MKDLPTPTLDLSPRKRGLPALLRKPLLMTGTAAVRTVAVPPPALPAEVVRADVPAATPVAARPQPYQIQWARHLDEVREAQRLRYQVFALEMGARLKSDLPEHDIDLFDDYCEHLLVRDSETGMVVGTYRVLTPAQSRRIGGFYTETEFDLVRLRHLRSNMVELGRSCVHAEHRSGGVILALWGALAEFMSRNQLDTMVACASIPLQHQRLPSGHAAASIWQQVREKHLAPIEYRVTPRLALPVDELQCDVQVDPPALIKGYLRMGAKVLGAPAWDPDFNTADLPMMVRVPELPARYRRQFGL